MCELNCTDTLAIIKLLMMVSIKYTFRCITDKCLTVKFNYEFIL